MIRESPPKDANVCPRAKRSNPSTLRPRLARWYAAALPCAPRPTTIASYAGIRRGYRTPPDGQIFGHRTPASGPIVWRRMTPDRGVEGEEVSVPAHTALDLESIMEYAAKL